MYEWIFLQERYCCSCTGSDSVKGITDLLKNILTEYAHSKNILVCGRGGGEGLGL